MKQILLELILMIFIVGCGRKVDETSTQGSPIQSTNLPAPTTGSVTTIEKEVLGTPTVTTLPPLPADPQRIEFSSEDGVNLVGMYYPAAINPAPMVVLMHWAGGDKNDWVRIGMTDWLTNRINFQGGGMYSPAKNLSEPYSFPNMPDNLSFGVFIFDFRGHGESDEEDTNLQAGWIQDATAAFEIAGSLPGVDPGRLVGIGASIGSDGVADTCADGCLGALSISPGNYLKIDYVDAVTKLTQTGKKAWCIAALDDHESATTCEGVRGIADQVIIYPNGGHGMMLFKPSLYLDPAIGQVILDFLVESFELSK